MTEALEIPFRQVDGLEIFVDAYIPASASAESPVPAIVWWHGGGLLQGTRKSVSPHMLRAPETHGLAILSAHYRLAPQVRMPAILSDLSALLHFLRTPNFAEATGHRVDVGRLVLSGSSAGGWLALMAGTGIGFAASGLPLPPTENVKGIAAIYPISDLQDPFWHTKQHPVSYMNGRIIDGLKELGPFLDPNAPPSAFAPADSPRANFYAYMVQEALLESLLLDGTGLKQSAFSIADGIRSGKFEVPPLYIIHGDIDDKVPLKQGTDVADAAKVAGVQSVMEIFPGKDHLFDRATEEDMVSYYVAVRNMLSA